MGAAVCAAVAVWPKTSHVRRPSLWPVVTKSTPVMPLQGSSVAIDPLGRGTWVVDEELDAVALVSDSGDVLSLPVGAWPEQVIVTPDGTAYVSCRQADTLAIIDTDFTIERIPVGAEPRALAFDEAEHRLYVGLVAQKALALFDTSTRKVTGVVDLPVAPELLALMTSGDLAILSRRSSSVFIAKPGHGVIREVRLPGRSAWYGQALAVRGDDLFVIHGEVNAVAVTPNKSHPANASLYGGGAATAEPIIAMRVSLVPSGSPTATDTELRPPAGDITGALISGGNLLLACRAEGTLVILALPMFEKVQPTLGLRLPGFADGITGLALAKDGSAYTFAAYDRELVVARKTGQPSRVLIGKGRLKPLLAAGRSLFHNASRMMGQGGITCASCHPDGRDDGRVWPVNDGFEGFAETPMLAGGLADTAPYGWHGKEDTLEEKIMQSTQRLGGIGFDGGSLKALALYLREGLRVPVPHTGDSPALVAEGESIFYSTQAGCSTCHPSELAFTDGELHQVRGQKIALDTPSLLHVSLSAPYFHDGSVKTLEELVAKNADQMGDTRSLDAHGKRALVAYLRSL